MDNCKQNVTDTLYKIQSEGGSLYRHHHNIQVNFDCLLKMFIQGLHCDIVLICDGRKLPAHKVILATCSTFFYAKLSINRTLKCLELKNITYETLSTIVKYFYTSEVHLTLDNVKDVWAAAFNFAILGLQDACCNFLQSNLSPNVCIQTAIMAKSLKCESLVSASYNCMAQHFVQIIAQDEYLQLNKDELEDLINRNIPYEAGVLLDCLVRWVRFCPHQRKDHMYSLIEYVPLSSLSLSTILQTIDQESWLKSDPQLMFEIIRSHDMKRPITPTIGDINSRELMIVAGIDDDRKFTIETYDFINNFWQKRYENFNIAKECGESRVAINGSTVYYLDFTRMKSLDLSCDLAHMAWRDCDPMLAEDREYYGVCVLDNFIYVVGGYCNSIKSATAERFDISAGRWERIADMSTGRHSLSLGTLRGRIYAVGGSTPLCSFARDVECYDPEHNVWHRMPPMSTGRRCSAVFAVGNLLFVAGGHQKWQVVESFNPATGKWSRIADLISGRTNHAGITINGRPHIIGGSCSICLNSVEVYDHESNAWMNLAKSMDTGKDYVAAALIDSSRIKL